MSHLNSKTKGAIAVGRGGGAFGVLPVGVDTFVLTVDSALPEGIKWAAPGSVSATFTQNVLAPGIDGQTVFALSAPRVAAGGSVLSVNGVVYAEGVNFTIVGAVLTWLDVPFTLQTTDSIIVEFQLT